MRIAVTGAAGFIGSHLCEALVAFGHEVVGLDNFDDFYVPAQKRDNLLQLKTTAGFRLIELDIRDRGAVKGSLHGCGAVVHLAARAGVRLSFAHTSLYADVNVTGTAVVLEAVAELGIPRLVFGSSSSVYGEGASVPFCEDASLGRAASPYAATKVAGEMLCRNFASRIPRLAILRFFTVYGPRQRPDLAIHKFARLILADQSIPVYGSLESFRDYTFVDDIVGGVMASLELEEPLATINLGSGNPIRLDEMIRHLESALGRSARLDRQPPQEGDLYGTWADVSRARELLGYSPRWRFEDGAQRFAEWVVASTVETKTATALAGGDGLVRPSGV
ncbi:MAG: NAD-dependent epimerase/dehydratase family protein [Actinomycetota bacterium]